jgi:hypothetical protein
VTASEDAAGQSTDVVRGWEAAAEVAGRSVAGLRKLVDGGRLQAEKAPDGAYAFRRADLLAVPRVFRVAEAEPPSRSGDGPDDAAATAPSQAETSAPTATPAVEPDVVLDGAMAARLFGQFEAGDSLVAVVIGTQVAPGIVEAAYTTWLRLKSTDLTSRNALSRMDGLDATLKQVRDVVQQLTAVVDAHDAVIAETSPEVWRQRQSVDGLTLRTSALERRGRPDPSQGELRGLRQRLGAVERALRALPASPFAIGVPCSACGHPLAVAACCTGCGAGRAALG